MKKRIIFAALAAMIGGSSLLIAQTPDPQVPSADIKKAALEKKKDQLQREIKEEDAKRNQIVPGVRPEVLEQINDSQDSLCLSLRSQLVDVELELKENTPPPVAAPDLINNYNKLKNTYNNGNN